MTAASLSRKTGVRANLKGAGPWAQPRVSTTKGVAAAASPISKARRLLFILFLPGRVSRAPPTISSATNLLVQWRMKS